MGIRMKFYTLSKAEDLQFQKLMKFFTDKKSGGVRESDDEKDVSDGKMAEKMGSSHNRKYKRKSDQSFTDESAEEGKRRRVENNVNRRRY